MPTLFSKKYFLFGVATLILVVGTGLAAHKTRSTDSAGETKSRPVKTMTVASQSFQPTETFSGTVRGAQQTTVAPKISGYVVSLKKEPGDRVASGEVLAVLEGNALETLNENAQNFLNASQESLEKAKRYFDQKVDEAEASLKKTKESRDAGDATDKDVAVAEESVQSAKKFRDAQLSQAESGVVSAQGNVSSAKTSSEDLLVKAPFSGIVTEKSSSVGSFVSPGTPLYTVTSPTTLEVTVSVPARIAHTLSKGTFVSVQPEGAEQSVQGIVFSTVEAVNQMTGETTVRIRFAKDADTSPLMLGQYAKVSFPADARRDAILVPESSLLHEYDETFVFVLQNGKAKKQRVTLGVQTGAEREILSGLEGGDVLVVEGTHALSEGMGIAP